MKARTKRLLVASVTGVSVVFLLVGAGVAYSLYIELSGNEHEVWSFERAEVIEGALEWARADPLPTSADVVSVTTGGSIFTRALRVTFTAPAVDIEDWLRRSPGAQDAVVTVPSLGVRHFQIKPGGGAAFAEITVDDTQQRVVIRSYWS